MWIALADKQDITRAGMQHVLGSYGDVNMRQTDDKYELIEMLSQHPDALCIIDYTLFDINDIEEMQILHDRFLDAAWIMFSVDLTIDFVRRIMAMGQNCSVLLKESPMHEIRECIDYAIRRRRYVCQRMTEMLLVPADTHAADADEVKLTRTETEILKDIALGTGFGLRYDMQFLVLRFDVGIALHLPYETSKPGFYNIEKFKDGLGLHFAIGYPF